MQVAIYNHPKYGFEEALLVEQLMAALGCNLSIYYTDTRDNIIETIIAYAAMEYDIDPGKLSSQYRGSTYVNARMSAIYIAIKYYNLTHSEIAKALHRDRTSVIHGYNRAVELISIQDGIAEHIDNIYLKIKSC